MRGARWKRERERERAEGGSDVKTGRALIERGVWCPGFLPRRQRCVPAPPPQKVPWKTAASEKQVFVSRVSGGMCVNYQSGFNNCTPRPEAGNKPHDALPGDESSILQTFFLSTFLLLK